MLTGIIRPVETRVLDVHADTLEELIGAMHAACPPGWEVENVPGKRIVRRDGVSQIEAPDMDALRALVPDGHQLLYTTRP